MHLFICFDDKTQTSYWWNASLKAGLFEYIVENVQRDPIRSALGSQ